MAVRHKGVVVADLPAKSLTDEARFTINRLGARAYCGGTRLVGRTCPGFEERWSGGGFGQTLVHPTIVSGKDGLATV